MSYTFISFGSGSCGNCYYIGTPHDAILIDSGIGIRQLKRHFVTYGIKRGNVRAIFVTHDHRDHVVSAGKIAADFGIPVYALPEIHVGMQRPALMSKKIPSEYRLPLQIGTPVQIANFTVTAFPIPHDATANVGYTIQFDDRVFSVMTDVGEVTPEITRAIGSSTHIVIEANYDPQMLQRGNYPYHLKKRISNGTGHLSNHQTAAAIAENLHPRLQRVWLCHLSGENNHPDLARNTVETQVCSATSNLSSDFQLHVLVRKDPTGPFEI